MVQSNHSRRLPIPVASNDFLRNDMGVVVCSAGVANRVSVLLFIMISEIAWVGGAFYGPGPGDVMDAGVNAAGSAGHEL
ncbi:hypothetical protein D3C84_1106080 [compost metagenome]